MTTLANLLLGKAGWWILGGTVLLLVGLAGAWRLEAAQRQAADLRAEAAQQQLATATQALEDRAHVIGALQRQEQAVRELREDLDPIRSAVHAAPRSTACVASPVVRAGLDRLRAVRDRAATTARAGPGAQPADLPARAAGTGTDTGR